MHRAVQWRSHPWLEPFADFVSTSHHAADADPNQKILGEMAKLVGNVGFGCFIMDVSRHQEVKYKEGDSKVARAVTVSSSTIWKNFFVFTYAKLRMLQFYYHCIDAFLDRRDFQYLEMDTNSAYVSLGGKSLEELVNPDKKEEFATTKHLSSGFPDTTRRSTPPTTNANRACSKWNGKETGLWVSIVRPTVAGAWRATKPAAKASARNSTIPRKSFT